MHFLLLPAYCKLIDTEEVVLFFFKWMRLKHNLFHYSKYILIINMKNKGAFTFEF